MLKRLISGLIALPFALLVVLFALSNRDRVAIELFPLPFVMELPLFLLPLGGAALGLVMGAVIMWLSGYKARQMAKRDAKRLEKLEKELAEIRQNALTLEL